MLTGEPEWAGQEAEVASVHTQPWKLRRGTLVFVVDLGKPSVVLGREWAMLAQALKSGLQRCHTSVSGSVAPEDAHTGLARGIPQHLLGL